VLSYFNTQHATRSTQIKPNTSIQVRDCGHVLLACVFRLNYRCCTLFGINLGLRASAGASARAQQSSVRSSAACSACICAVGLDFGAMQSRLC
jgi:hypothetical protein